MCLCGDVEHHHVAFRKPEVFHSIKCSADFLPFQLRNMLPGKNQAYSELVHRYLVFDDEMTLIGAMWRDTEMLVHEYK